MITSLPSPTRALTILSRRRPRLLDVGRPSGTTLWCFDKCPTVWNERVDMAFFHNGRPLLSASASSSAHPTIKVSDPLRILFCGSDMFSCASLEAIHREKTQNPSLVESIDVVVRPGKRMGRGNKEIRHPPLRDLANNLGLRIHERDTFTGWDMPQGTNLIIAVSFGLFVPARLLRASKYGGLNLHPSLLPDLRGPAPLHHALLLGRRTTGVTLQTLDAAAFDHGVVLAQTPGDGDAAALRIPDDCTTVPQLLDIVTPVAADMLVCGLRDGLHVPPLVDAGWWRGGFDGSPKLERDDDGSWHHAPKITSRDRQVTSDILRLDMEERLRSSSSSSSSPSSPSSRGVLARRQDAIGPLWFWSRHPYAGPQRRVIIVKLEELSAAERLAKPPKMLVESSEDVDGSAATAGQHRDDGSDDLLPRHYYSIPFEEEGEGGAAATSSPPFQPKNNTKSNLKLIFWRPDQATASHSTSSADKTRDDEEVLYLGNYRVTTLKLEGDRARGAQTAVRHLVTTI